MSALEIPDHIGPATALRDAPRDHLVVLPDVADALVVELPARPVVDAAKRTFDVLAGLLMVLVATPLLLGLALLVRIGSPGPVLYRQERFGRNGATFTMYKFRSMYVDADAKLAELLAADPELADEYQRTVKLKDDPRITGIGRFLRRTSLDELPQLLNVCRGDMSIVGPRPIRDVDLPHYGRHVGALLSVRPGLTGRWQVSGRSELPMDERVRIDVDYARTHDLRSDLAILLRTPAAVLKGTGAW